MEEVGIKFSKGVAIDASFQEAPRERNGGRKTSASRRKARRLRNGTRTRGRRRT